MTPSPSRSDTLFARAKELIPGGVSSPVRAFGKVGGGPRYMSRGEGAYLFDEEGERYLDVCMAWGPLILGHAHPAVLEAVAKAAHDGLAFGTTHRHEVELAELVMKAFPEHERVRFVVSGTEAVTTAMRLARGATGRSMILKFTGCYHGHVDSLLVKAGSGLVTQGLAESKGVPEAVASNTVVLPLNDLSALKEAFARFGPKLAAAIIEPLPANNGMLPQQREFLHELRALCSANGALLVFDEVINGFRFRFGGYGHSAGVKPDLTTLGKIVGGGLPVAALVGPKSLMEQLAPLGPVYQAGTMAGNPVALAAGIATLTELAKGDAYVKLEQLGARLEETWQKSALSKRLRLQRWGSVFWPYAGLEGELPRSAEAIDGAAVERYHGWYRRWLAAGVYLPPSGYEVSFLSTAHTLEQMDTLVGVLEEGSRA
jgi:glutamate-1-semialdehyde 2,1-aminomutase